MFCVAIAQIENTIEGSIVLIQSAHAIVGKIKGMPMILLGGNH
jgi:hypothetical protein